jgi:hypothetical protein
MSSKPGIKEKCFIHFVSEKNNPLFIPRVKNRPHITPTLTAISKGEKPIKAAPIPAPNASRERAKPNKKASFPVIAPELSRSATIGFLRTLMIMPSFLISRFKIVSLSLTDFGSVLAGLYAW